MYNYLSSVYLFLLQKFRNCLRRIAIVDDTLKQLGTTTDYKELHTKTVWFVLGWFIIIILMMYAEVEWLRYHYGSDKFIIIYVPFILNYCTHMNLIDDFIVANVLRYVYSSLSMNQNIHI